MHACWPGASNKGRSATSMSRRSSPTCARTTSSCRRRSSVRSSRPSGSRTTTRRSGSPTAANTGWHRRSGPPMLGGRPGWRRRRVDQHPHAACRRDAPRRVQAFRVRQGPVDVRVRRLHPDQARHAVPRLRGLTLGSSVPAFHTLDDAGRARRLGRCGIADRPEPGQVLADGGEGPDRVDQTGGVLSRRPG